ncbi:hypothetical protein V8F20_012738 [Naviculisporaceae sp. PSN 640]
MPRTSSKAAGKAGKDNAASIIPPETGLSTSSSRPAEASSSSTQVKSNQDLKDAMAPLPCGSIPTVLGLDLGSSGIRMVLRYKVDGKWERTVVENDKARFRDDPRRDKGSFTSDCSELGKSAFVHPDVPLATGRSIKYHLYLLAKVSDKFLAEEFPWIAEEKKHLETIPDYAVHLEQGLLELFTALAGVVQRTCEVRTVKLQIVRICLTTPSQFGHEVSEIYENLVSRAFGLPTEGIVHCNEAQAMAHFIFDNHVEVEYETGVSSPDVGIFIDCGGHTTSIAAYQIQYSEEGEPVFIEIGSSRGTGGGSEDWLWGQISNRCEPVVNEQLHSVNMKLRNDGLPQMSQDDIKHHWQSVRTEILAKFLADKKRAETEPEQFKGIRIPYLLPVGDTFGNVNLTQEIIAECWGNATNRIKDLLQARLGELVSAGRNIVTVVHGGTSRAPAMKAIVSGVCQQHGLPAPFFMETMAGLQRYDSIAVANGAALVGCNNATVEEALHRGAVFSLQVWQKFPTNKNRDAKAYRLLDMRNKGPRNVVIPIETGDKVILLCDPMHNKPGMWSRKKWIDPDNSYDFLDLSLLLPTSTLTTGWYRFVACLTGSGDEMNFTIRVQREGNSDVDGDPAWTIDMPSLGLYWDRGQNCVLPGKPKMTIVEYLSNLGLQVEPQAEGDEDVIMTDVQDEGGETSGTGVSQTVSIFGGPGNALQQPAAIPQPEQGDGFPAPPPSTSGSGWFMGVLGGFRG